MSDFSAKVKRRLEKIRRYGFVPVVKQYLHRKLYGRRPEYRRYIRRLSLISGTKGRKAAPYSFLSVCLYIIAGSMN